MKRLKHVLFFTVFIIICTLFLNAGKDNLIGMDNSVDEGKKLYSTLCWTCHGHTGAGDGPATFAMDENPADFNEESVKNKNDKELFNTISNGSNTMRGYNDMLTDSQIKSLVLYVRHLQNQ